MNVLSLFDGMSCGQIALNKLGIKYNNYFACEIDKYAIQTAQKNYPNTQQLGDVTKLDATTLPKIDLLIGGSPCFTGENLVMTSNGYVPIKEIKVGDMVLTHQNRYRKVLRIGGEKKETIIIKSQGSTKIETTKNHPFYCFEIKNKDYEFTWKNIGDFNEEDKVVSINWGLNKDSEQFSDVDLYIMGRFLADGCCFKTKRKNRENSYIYKFKISVGKHELENFKNKVDDRFSYVEDRTVFNAFIYKKEWVEIGEKFGHLAHNKFIPNFILDLPVERLKIFLEGYMDGDGHIRKRASKINIYKRNTTVSEKLALTLSLAIQKCYNGVSICHSERKDKHIIENRIVNQKDTYEVSYTENKTKFSNYKSFKNYTAYNLTKSTSFKESGINNVYNIEVEEDNSYIVNNLIVHNCQGFSFAGKQLNFDDPRSKLFFEFVRILNEVRINNPDVKFLLENVKMKKEFSDIISEHMGVEPIRINSSLVSAQNRLRLYWTNIEGIEQPENRKIYLKDILEPIVDDKYYISKIAIEKLNRHNNKVIKETSLPEKSGTIHAGYFKMGGRDQQYIKDIPICINSKGGRNGIPGLQPSLQDRIYLDEGKFTAITPSFMPYVITIDSHHSESELKCVGALGGNKKWLDNGKNLQRNFSQGERIYSTDGKSPCLSANSGGSTGVGNALITDDINDKYKIRKLTPIECERLQTVPDNYTEGVSNTQRYKMLGNGWTVDVIAHIFKNIEI